MTFHVVAHFLNNQGVSGVEPSVVQDDVVNSNVGTRFLVPADYNFVHFVVARGTLFNRIRMSAPSLEVRRYPFYVVPVDKRSVFGDQYIPIYAQYPGGLQLVPTEELRYLIDLASASSAAPHYIFTVFGPREPRRGDLAQALAVRATFSGSVTARTWSSLAISFDVPLEVGEYEIVGAVAAASGAVMSRLIIPGQVWRPPVWAVVSGDPIATSYSPNALGPWLGYSYGTFRHTTPPQLQVMTDSATSVSGQLYLWLRKTGA